MKLRSQPGTGEREERVAQNTGNHRGAGGGGRGKLKDKEPQNQGTTHNTWSHKTGNPQGAGKDNPHHREPQGGGGYHGVGGGA